MLEQIIAILCLLLFGVLLSYCVGRLSDNSFGYDNDFVMLSKGFVKLCIGTVVCIVLVAILHVMEWAILVLLN